VTGVAFTDAELRAYWYELPAQSRNAKRMQERRRRQRAVMEQWRSLPCEHCQDTARRHQMAHLRPTKVSGRGRGTSARYRDSLRHPDHYAVLCTRCHIHLDRQPDVQWARCPADLPYAQDPPPWAQRATGPVCIA
jgi:hypothetical protein